MKFFRKKNNRPSEIKTSTASDTGAEHSFYSRHAGETPLEQYSSDPGSWQQRRTSKNSPVRRRETSNRTSNWTLTLLLMKALFVVLLLVAGFIVLKLVLTRLEEPSEKDRQRWEERALLMQKTATESSEFSTPMHQGQPVDVELIRQKLAQWKQTDQHVRAAEALIRRGIDDEAIRQLNQAVQSSPRNQTAQKLLLDIYMKKGRYADAVPLCICLLDQTGEQPNLLINLLAVLHSSGQTEAAVALADYILTDQPNHQEVLAFAASGKAALGDPDAAASLFKHLLELNEKNKDALIGCGVIYFNRGDYEQAIPYFLELVRMDPEPEYYRTLALCYAQRNEAEKAVIFMGQAYSLFGSTEVSPWLKEPGFDPVRESADFRSFADRLVGAETRKAIEAISRRDAEKASPALPAKLDLPQQPQRLQLKN